MSRYQQFQVIDPDGVRATLLTTSRFLDGDRQKLIRTEDGNEVFVPNELLQPMNDNSFRLTTPLRSLLGHPEPAPEKELNSPAIIPEIEEQLQVGRQKVEIGRIRLRKRVEESSAVVDEPLLQENFRVDRVPVNRILADGNAPQPRYEGEVLILPVLEEVLVVEKRLVLREEIRVTPDRREVRDPQTHALRREHIDVERLN